MRRALQLGACCAFLVFMLAAAEASESGTACEQSGYCSIGKLRPFFGDIYPGSGLREALEARSYKKEIILMAITSSQVLPLLQVVLNLRNLGIENILIISTTEDECTKVNHHLSSFGCVWSIFQVDKPKDLHVASAAPLWHTRWRTLARAVKLGYNVLSTDTDVVFYHDPYNYFKSAPFKDFTIINQAETIFDIGDYPRASLPNGGVIYVQNASPTGPGAWLISEVAHRLLRFIDTNWTHVQAQGGRQYCGFIDQDMFRDALYASRSGVLTFHDVLISCISNEWKEAHSGTYRDRTSALNVLLRNTISSTRVPVPAWMVPVAGEESVLIRNITMRMPHVGRGGWNESLGGNCYGEPGSLSTALYRQLKRDCQPDDSGPDCPMWPDPEDRQTAEAATAVPTEPFLFAPPFLMFGYYPRGRLGYWIPEALRGGPVQQVLGHLHYNPTGQMAQISKLIAKHSVRMFDWSVAHNLHSNVFRMQQGLNQGKPRVRPDATSDERIPSLVALHPSVRLDRLKGIKEYQEVLIGLAQVAKLTGRGVLYPDLPCELPWLAGHSLRKVRHPLELRPEWFPYAPAKPRGGGPVEVEEDLHYPLNHTKESEEAVKRRLMCMWAHISYDACFHQNNGMFMMEFEHLEKNLGRQVLLGPGRSNTILTLATEAEGMDLEASPASLILVVTAAEVIAAGAKLSTWRVLYVGHPVNVLKGGQDMNNELGVNEDCPALSRSNLRSKYFKARPTLVHDIIRRRAHVQGSVLSPVGGPLEGRPDDAPLSG